MILNVSIKYIDQVNYSQNKHNFMYWLDSNFCEINLFRLQRFKFNFSFTTPNWWLDIFFFSICFV